MVCESSFWNPMSARYLIPSCQAKYLKLLYQDLTKLREFCSDLQLMRN